MLSLKEIAIGVVAGSILGIGFHIVESHFKSQKSARINSVFNTTDGKFPALVRLETMDGRFFCSGSVISDEWVLTAAHCVNGAPEAIAEGQEITLLVASLKDSKGETTKIKGMPLYANYRADYALVHGNFSEFNKMQVETSPVSDLLYKKNLHLETCGFPYGSSGVCYPTLSEINKYVDQFSIKGQLYAGMSGGPVVDISTGKVVGVNTAVMKGEVVISPLIGLFQLLE